MFLRAFLMQIQICGDTRDGCEVRIKEPVNILPSLNYIETFLDKIYLVYEIQMKKHDRPLYSKITSKLL